MCILLLGARDVKVKTNSRLFVSKVKREAEVKDPLLQKYQVMVREKFGSFDSFEVAHVPGEYQTRADLQETLERPSHEKLSSRFSGVKSLIRFEPFNH